MKSYGQYNLLHEAILYEDVNVETTQQTFKFYIKSIVPLKDDIASTISINHDNITNLNKNWITTPPIIVTNTLNLSIPRYLKYSDTNDNIIHKGTKFYVGFISGNINQPIIIGRET